MLHLNTFDFEIEPQTNKPFLEERISIGLR